MIQYQQFVVFECVLCGCAMRATAAIVGTFVNFFFSRFVQRADSVLKFSRTFRINPKKLILIMNVDAKFRNHFQFFFFFFVLINSLMIHNCSVEKSSSTPWRLDSYDYSSMFAIDELLYTFYLRTPK